MVVKIIGAVSLSRSGTTSEIKKPETKEQKNEVVQTERLIQATQRVLGGSHRCEDSGDSQIRYPIEESGQNS